MEGTVLELDLRVFNVWFRVEEEVDVKSEGEHKS